MLIILVIWRATNWDKEEAKDRNVRQAKQRAQK